MVQQHQAHPWALSFLLLLVGLEVLEDQQVPVAQIEYFSHLVLDSYPPERCYENKPKMDGWMDRWIKSTRNTRKSESALTISPLGPASPLNPEIPGSP